ncbi:Dihydroflavonol 4-reductase [Glycine soja]
MNLLSLINNKSQKKKNKNNERENMGSSSASESVCVTGASGFIGSWLVMRLIERGYTVRATVRDPANMKKVKHLVELPGAKTKLSLWKADLAQEGSFDEAIKGCTGVFHVATPMDFDSKDPENEVIKPTINGLLDIMKACVKAKTVRRLVFTSSAGTVDVTEHPNPVIDENCWSDVDFCTRVKMTGNESHYHIIKQGQFVHLDDLCLGHIFVFENPKAEGRYICCSHEATIHDIAKLLNQKYPEYNVLTKFKNIPDELDIIKFSSKKITDLGFKFKYSLEDMFTGAKLQLMTLCGNKYAFILGIRIMCDEFLAGIVFDRGGSVIGVVILCNPLELVSWGMLLSHVYSKLRVSL